jgi:hypothetical protein
MLEQLPETALRVRDIIQDLTYDVTPSVDFPCFAGPQIICVVEGFFARKCLEETRTDLRGDSLASKASAHLSVQERRGGHWVDYGAHGVKHDRANAV